MGLATVIFIILLFLFYNFKYKGFSEELSHSDLLNIIEEDLKKYPTTNRSKEENYLILKEETFDYSNIQDYEREDLKKFIYRPKNLEEYIGQENAKNLVRLNIEKIKKYKHVHFLISGIRGHGKTTLAYIIKNLLNANMFYYIGGSIRNPKQIEEIVNKINTSTAEYDILFIDEIHALDPKLCEIFYPIMEDFKIGNKKIKPFILIGATTEKQILLNKVAPLVDRFNVHINLDRYNVSDLVNILKQYNKNIYNENIAENVYIVIAKNCRLTPRIAISLLDDYIVIKDINKVLQYRNIIIEGLTKKDFEILKILNSSDKPIGEKALAMSVGLTSSEYVSIYEPYLVEMNYILRTSRGRTIANKGKEILRQIIGEI